MDEFIIKLDKERYETIIQSLELAYGEFGGEHFINLQHELIKAHSDPRATHVKHKDDGSPSQAAKFGWK